MDPAGELIRISKSHGVAKYAHRLMCYGFQVVKSATRLSDVYPTLEYCVAGSGLGRRESVRSSVYR